MLINSVKLFLISADRSTLFHRVNLLRYKIIKKPIIIQIFIKKLGAEIPSLILILLMLGDLRI